MKTCQKCKRELSEECFHHDKTHVDGLSYRCRRCRSEDAKAWRQNNLDHKRQTDNKWRRANRSKCLLYERKYRATHKERVRAAERKRRIESYGIAVEDYDRLFILQGGVCAVCGQHETATNQYGVKDLSIDHNHRTGRVRGLLCQRCNWMVGWYEQSKELQEQMNNYLNTATAT